jgi:hypothetical protein
LFPGCGKTRPSVIGLPLQSTQHRGRLISTISDNFSHFTDPRHAVELTPQATQSPPIIVCDTLTGERGAPNPGRIASSLDAVIASCRCPARMTQRAK